MKVKLFLLIAIMSAAVASCSGTRHSALNEGFSKAERLVSSKPDSSLAILRRMEVSRSDRHDYATWCLLKTWAEYNSYVPDISEEQLADGTEYFLKRHCRERRALSHYLRAVVQDESGTYSKAQMADDLKRGCREIEGSDNHYLASLLYMRYGCEMNERKWYSKGIEALNTALSEAEKGNLTILQVTIRINLSHAYMFLADEDRDYTKALEETEKAIEIARNNHLEDSYAKALNARAVCCSRAGMADEALDCALKANKIAERRYSTGASKEPASHIALADAYRKTGNADSAIFYALKDTSAVSIITRATATQLLYIVYRDLLKDDSKAIQYMSEFNEIKNTVSEIQENDKVVKNEVELEHEIEAGNRSHILRGCALAIALAFAALAGIVLIHRRRMMRKDSTIIEQSEELEKKTGEIMQTREELHNEIVGKSLLMQELKDNPHYLNDTEADSLVALVDKAYGGYCSELAALHHLTKANIRLAALVRLGFSTGQIAAMEGISPTSVTKAKQRLKAKTGSRS